jgi:hypothetical protein
MANTTYQVPLSRFTNPATRRDALLKLCDVLLHLDALAVDLVSVNKQGQNLNVVLSDPLPAEQLEHLGFF